MVCHCKRLANESLVLFEKNWTSLGNRRPCTKLSATLPPSPWAHALMLANAGRGPSLNLKLGCQMFLGRDEDAMFVPTLVNGRGSPIGSRIIISPLGGVVMGASLGILGGWSPTRCFIFGWLTPGEWEHGPRLKAGWRDKCWEWTGQQSFFAYSPYLFLDRP